MKNVILILIISILSTGCSLIGFGLGSFVKVETEKNISIEDKIDRDMKITVTKFDDSKIVGSINQIKEKSEEIYKTEFENFMNKKKLFGVIPNFGETLKAENIKIDNYTEGLKLYNKNFLGFDFNSILIGDSAYKNTIKIPFSTIEYFGNGEIENNQIKNLAKLYEKGELPLISDFEVFTQNKILTIPGNQIKEIKIHDKSNLAAYGLILGLAVDAYIISNFKYEGIIHLGTIR